MTEMTRSHFTLDLEAVRHNTRTLVRELGGAELWAVVKADGVRPRGGRRGARSARGRSHCDLRRHGGRGETTTTNLP